MPSRRATAAGAVLVIALATTACSRGDRDPTGAGPPTSATPRSPDTDPPTTTTTTTPAVDLVFVGLDPNGTAPPGDDVVAKVQATLRGYFADGILAPLRSGGPAPDLSPYFTPVVLERLAGPDRATMVEEGLPAARSVTADSTAVALNSVAGPDEVTAVIAARIDWKLHAVGPGLDVDIVRTGELVLVDAGDTWRIDGFQVRTTRDSRG